MSDELTAWLRDQVDKDEWCAGSAHYFPCAQQVWHGAGPQRPSCDCGLPQRMLAEVGAKRRVLDLLDVTEDREMPAEAWILAKQIRAAMLPPYADREGYDAAWTVD
jgi:hypothetical protein